MKLSGKTVLVFAAYGAIARHVAKACAQQGAELFLSGRSQPELDALAQEVVQDGGKAHTHVVDATSPEAVRTYVQQVHALTGRIDAVFNGIGIRAAQGGYGTPATDIDFETFMLPIRVHAGSQFLTAREAGRYMVQQGEGSILLLSASLGKDPAPFMNGIGAACGAIEALTRALACEFAQTGVRVNCINCSALVETRTIRETTELNAARMGMDVETFQAAIAQRTMTRRFPSLHEVGQLSAYLVSPASSVLTGQVVNATAGLVLL